MPTTTFTTEIDGAIWNAALDLDNKKVRITEDGAPVASATFDPPRLDIAAGDHLTDEILTKLEEGLTSMVYVARFHDGPLGSGGTPWDDYVLRETSYDARLRAEEIVEEAEDHYAPGDVVSILVYDADQIIVDSIESTITGEE